MSWPSLGELVNYDPQMAQWEGDGELVGVRSKVILTYNGNMLPRHRTSYLSKVYLKNSLNAVVKKRALNRYRARNSGQRSSWKKRTLLSG